MLCEIKEMGLGGSGAYCGQSVATQGRRSAMYAGLRVVSHAGFGKSKNLTKRFQYSSAKLGAAGDGIWACDARGDVAMSAFLGRVIGSKKVAGDRMRCIARAGWTSMNNDTSERSAMVNREVVLFLIQLELDSQLQRALTYDNFDLVKELRRKRDSIDEALRELQKEKGYGCGSRHARDGSQFNLAPQALAIRADLSRAIEEEKYDEAARLRDKLTEIEESTEEANMPCPVAEPAFSLGQMIVHTTKGYRGVVCGWDLACCEDDAWKTSASTGSLKGGEDQVFYHVLVDVGDWPLEDELAPVAYVAEELLDEASMADFESDEPLVNSSFQHPYSYLMFLGSDGHGNLIPARQLREKYCIERRDVHPPGQGDSDESDGDDEFPFGSNGNGNDPNGNGNNGSGNGNDIWGGGPTIPGIDMRSLE